MMPERSYTRICRAEPLEVGFTAEGLIKITQEDGLDDPGIIVLYASQIDIFIEWVRLARDEAVKAAAGA